MIFSEKYNGLTSKM